MSDFLSKLSAVSTEKVTDSKKEIKKTDLAKIRDSRRKRELERIRDSRRKRTLGKQTRVNRSKIRDSRNYRSLLLRVKDELEQTTTTEEAIEVVENAVSDLPAEQVAVAVVEILAQTIDDLTDKLESVEQPTEDPELLEEVTDSYASGDIYDKDGIFGTISEVETTPDGKTVLHIDVVDDEGNITSETVNVE